MLLEQHDKLEGRLRYLITDGPGEDVVLEKLCSHLVHW